MRGVFVATQYSMARFALHHCATSRCLSGRQLLYFSMVTGTGLGRVVFGSNDKREMLGQQSLELLVRSRCMSRTEASIAPYDDRVGGSKFTQQRRG